MNRFKISAFLILGLSLCTIRSLTGWAASDVITPAAEIPSANYFSANPYKICVEQKRMQARKGDSDIDMAEIERQCRGPEKDGDEISEEMEDLYQICRLRPSYKKFQKCMVDATSIRKK